MIGMHCNDLEVGGVRLGSPSYGSVEMDPCSQSQRQGLTKRLFGRFAIYLLQRLLGGGSGDLELV